MMNFTMYFAVRTKDDTDQSSPSYIQKAMITWHAVFSMTNKMGILNGVAKPVDFDSPFTGINDGSGVSDYGATVPIVSGSTYNEIAAESESDGS
jgi:hypothetical protein